MRKIKNNIEKLCSFYVSDWHMVTMLLPYINKKTEENVNIITILEQDIEENIKMLIKKLNLKNENKILELNWKKTTGIKYEETKNKMQNLIDKENNIILISGSKAFIDGTNCNMKKFFEENIDKFEDVNIKVINCYEVGDFNFNITAILQQHDKILNTSGEKEINEVFEGYA